MEEKLPVMISPHCGVCKTEPFNYSARPNHCGPIDTIDFFCSSCGAVIGISIVAMRQPQNPMVYSPI